MKTEKWNTEQWLITLFMVIIFPPIGIAISIRKILGLRVFK